MHHPTDRITHTTVFVTRGALVGFFDFLISPVPIMYTFPISHTLSINEQGRKAGHVLFNEALNTFYLWLFGVGFMVKDHFI